MFAYNWWYGTPPPAKPKNFLEAGWEVLQTDPADTQKTRITTANLTQSGRIDEKTIIVEDYHGPAASRLDPRAQLTEPASDIKEESRAMSEQSNTSPPPQPAPPAPEPSIAVASSPTTAQPPLEAPTENPEPTKVNQAVHALTNIMSAVASSAYATASASASISPRKTEEQALSKPSSASEPAPATVATSKPSEATKPAEQSSWTVFQMPVVIGVSIFLFSILYPHWTHIVATASFYVRNIFVIVLSLVTPLYVFPKLPQSFNLIIAFVIALATPTLVSWAYWPIILFSIGCGISHYLNHDWDGPWSSKFHRQAAAAPLDSAMTAQASSDREWLNTLAKTLLEYIAALKIRRFDIGGTLPQFKTVEFAPRANTAAPGFDMLVRYEYNTDASTLIELEVPVSIPGYGESKLPVFVAGPRLSGRLRIQCNIVECTYKQRDRSASTELGDALLIDKKENFLALALAFEPIQDVHVGDLRVSVAPRFEWLQWFSIVKRQMVSLFNSLLSTDKISIYVFDASFASLGVVLKNSPVGVALKDIKMDELYDLQSIISEKMLQCTKCHRKTFEESAACCPCEKH